MPKVRLIAATSPVIDEAGSNAGEFVAYVARVSNPSNQQNHETSPRLLSYLQRHKHWSPFELSHAVMEIVTTRDIARQILRHRSFSFQELSQRYSSEMEMAEPREARAQDTKNRQNSLQIESNRDIHEWWRNEQNAVLSASISIYEDAIARGIAKEVARSVLPEGLTVSRIFMAGSLRSWIHYLEVRRDPSTQKEHREVADAAHMALQSAFPEIFTDQAPT